MANLPSRPKFTYTNDGGLQVVLAMSLPARPWVPGNRAVGGREFSAARVPGSFEIRRDKYLRVTLVFTWAEWPDIEALLAHGQRGTLVTVQPDQADATARDCYLWEPGMDQDIDPRPGANRGQYEVDTMWVDDTDQGWGPFPYHG